MSYCRWSSDNWKSDLYCYESCDGGWTTHVGGNRIVGKLPDELPIRNEGWMERHKEIMKALKTVKREPIGLPHDGESFNDPTIETFLERVEDLKVMGYHVPDYVIPLIKEEIEEGIV